MSDLAGKREEIVAMLPQSKLIADSPYTVNQWEAIVKVIPRDYLEQLYAFLLLEKKKSTKDQKPVDGLE